MARLKEGSGIKTEVDLQVLISSVILRRGSSFSEAEIYARVMAHLGGSDFSHSNGLVRAKVQSTIKTMVLGGQLTMEELGSDQYILAIPFPPC